MVLRVLFSYEVVELPFLGVWIFRYWVLYKGISTLCSNIIYYLLKKVDVILACLVLSRVAIVLFDCAKPQSC